MQPSKKQKPTSYTSFLGFDLCSSGQTIHSKGQDEYLFNVTDYQKYQ